MSPLESISHAPVQRLNAALILGQQSASLDTLAIWLEGFGLQALSQESAPSPDESHFVPRVLLLNEDASDAVLRLSATKTWANAEIRLAISGSVPPISGLHCVMPPGATEQVLLDALLDGGYHLPADAECAAIPQVLHKLVEGDEEVVRELVDSLLNTGESDLIDYQARCAQEDWPAAGSLAHRIKGTARMSGCSSLTRVSERIESAARNEGGAAIMSLNRLFVPGVRRLCDALRALQLAR